MSNAVEPATKPEISIQDVQRTTLQQLQHALENGQHEAAHCLAETYEVLVHAETMEHHAVRAHVERALRQLEAARVRAPAGANAAVSSYALETA
jgi:hypothetical protein